MPKLYLLDAYALIYRAYYALINSPRINAKKQNVSAVFGFVNTLEEILQNEHPDYIAVAFDPSGPTFRHEAFAPYKAQREATPEDIKISVPIIKDIIRAYNIPILEMKGYEADDVIGTAAKKAAAMGVDVFMFTPDKDYAQLVEEHITMCRPGHGSKPTEKLGPIEVCTKYGLKSPLQFIDMLGLMGDTADNFPGCPGVGEKTAMKLIAKFGSIDNLLANTDKLKPAMRKKVEENRESIEMSKFLATIRTDVPIDIDIESLRRKESNLDEIRRIFEELGFRTLLARVLKGAGKGPAATASQPSLFDTIDNASSEASESEAPTHLDSIKTVTHNYRLVESEEEMKMLAELLLTKEAVCLDTETTATDALTAQLVGLSFSHSPFEAWYVPVPQDNNAAMAVLEIFRPLYENYNILKIGQNLKYDLEVLGNYGIKLAPPHYDTMIAHYLVQPELRHNMDFLAETYLKYKTIHIDELIGPKGKGQKNMADLAPKDVYEYACEDADITLRLMSPLDEEMKKLGLKSLFTDIEMPLMPVLAQMERNGVCLDTAALAETGRLFKERMGQLEKEIYELAGHEFTITSPKQVGEVLFGELKLNEKAKKTKSGQYSTSEEVLESLRAKHPIVEKILDHRGLKKLLSTYIDALPKLINPQTGHIHTSFNQTITATGRLSSSNPNLQNIPVRGEDGREIRKAFIPEEGCTFFSADYSQIELRIMADLSQDPHLLEDFREGKDIHASTAARIYKKDVSEVSRDERRKAKTANFGIIYGISAFGLAERMEVSRTEAKELIDNYFNTYPGVREFINKSIAIAKEKGYIETRFGRRRYLPDINSGNSVVRGYAERNAVNAPIQGTAADIIKIAMNNIAKRFAEEGIRSKMILQVHDELNFSVYPNELERVKAIVVGEMENACKMSVPLLADCGEGKNWLEAH